MQLLIRVKAIAPSAGCSVTSPCVSMCSSPALASSCTVKTLTEKESDTSPVFSILQSEMTRLCGKKRRVEEEEEEEGEETKGRRYGGREQCVQGGP